MTTKEIAERINAHLKRFESDPEINVRPGKNRITPYYQAWSGSSGAWVYVVYVSFQGKSCLRKSDAEKYLAWLDAGNVGRHWHVGRAEEPER